MAWKDLAELAPQLTEAEIRFEKKKRFLGLTLGPLAFALCLFLPPLPHVTPVGMRSLAIFSWAVLWWITEAVPIPVTSLLLLPLIAVCGLFPFEKALGYWGHWTNLFLLGAFLIGHAMEKYGLTRRVASPWSLPGWWPESRGVCWCSFCSPTSARAPLPPTPWTPSYSHPSGSVCCAF